jgi:hypothetical protein
MTARPTGEPVRQEIESLYQDESRRIPATFHVFPRSFASKR